MTANSAPREISTALTEAIQSLVDGYKGSSLTDIYLVVDRDSGGLSIYDDEENLLSQHIIEPWRSIDDDECIARQLRSVVEEFDMNNKFDRLDVFKPFSVNIADEDFNVQEELLLIEDDSIIRLENDFMKHIDQEFDEFLEKILKE